MSGIDPALVLRLGWTLVHFLWQGAALAGALALLLWLAKGRSPRLRYGLACAVLAVMALAPVLTWYQLRQPQTVSRVVLAPSNQAAPDATSSPRMEPSSPAAEVVPVRRAWNGILPLAVGLWLLGVTAMSLRLASGWAWLQWLRRRPETVPASDDLQLRLLRLCQRMNLASNIRILLCEKVPGPTVMGWLRPVILLPPAALLGMPPDQLELVLAHELAHILRHDFAINLLQSCVEVLLFYHPAVWWVSAKIRQERELCCDDLAVRTTGDALDYAAALTRLEALCRPPDPPRHAARALALGATGGSFMHRIRRLISPIAPTPLAPRAGLVLILVFGLAMGLKSAQAKAETAKPEVSRELLLRRFNADSADGVAKAGQISFVGEKVPPGAGLMALQQLAATPANGPVTELRWPMTDEIQSGFGPYSYNLPAVDPSRMRMILENHASEGPLTLQSCPPRGVIIRRLNAATPLLHPLPGKSRLAVVANEADIELVSELLNEMMNLKGEPLLFQRIQRTGEEAVPEQRKMTIDLSDVDADEFRMVLDTDRAKRALPAERSLLESSDLGNRFTPGQFPPDGTMWLRRYDRDSADGKRRAGTVYVHVKNVTAAEITDAITRLAQTAPDASKGFAELEMKATPSKSPRPGLYSYLFLGADPVRVRRVVQARDGFVYLEKADKKPGHIVIQRLSRFTSELGLLPQGLSVQVWAGDVPAELVLEALTELMAMTPEAGVPQEVRRQIPPGSGLGNRVSLDLVDTDPLKLWNDLEAARKGQP